MRITVIQRNVADIGLLVELPCVFVYVLFRNVKRMKVKKQQSHQKNMVFRAVMVTGKGGQLEKYMDDSHLKNWTP